jgi:type I restriction enzyme S subunit
MSKYKPYPKYKKSGVEWLGDVPEGWEVSKFGFIKTILTDYTANGSFSSLAKNVKYIDTPNFARLIRLTDLRKNLQNTNGVWIDEQSYNFLKKSTLYGGEFLLANVGAYAGLFYQMPYVNFLTSLAPNMFMAKFNSLKVKREYMAYIGISYSVSEQLKLKATASSAQPKLNKDDFKSVKFTFPSLKEQIQIANYLDQKTKKIDTLIEKQQTLIKLLKEKRQAVINHAVTKGLDGSVEMKDSGVAWLGDVPKHWIVCMFKYKTNKITDGAHISPELKNGKYYFLSVKDITTGKLNFSEALLTSEKSYNYLVKTGCKPKKNDILFGKDGTVGVTAVVQNKNNFVISSSLLIFRPKNEIYSQFMNYQCNGNYFKNQVNSFLQGVALKRLSIQNVLKIWATFPPLKEQKEIANYLDQKTKQIDTLITKSTKAIELLKERRTALISAVVTGKIDVQNA